MQLQLLQPLQQQLRPGSLLHTSLHVPTCRPRPCALPGEGPAFTATHSSSSALRCTPGERSCLLLLLPAHHLIAPLPCLPPPDHTTGLPVLRQQQPAAVTSSRRWRGRPIASPLAPPCASRSGSPGDADDGDDSAAAAASSSSSSSGAAAAAAGSLKQPAPDNPWLALPLLILSSFSHVNRQYIRLRRRRKWWGKLGGYPKVRRVGVCVCK
jgi:hypothetical protein